MSVSKLWQFGSICLLMLSCVFSSKAQANCEQTYQAEKAGYSASLAFSGSCERGMFILTLNMPDGRQQTMYEAYQQPITAIWLEPLSNKPQPELVMLQQPGDSLQGLIVYSWVNNHFQKMSLTPPDTALLDDYAEQDKVYVRWGELVRQIKLADPESAGWRRLRYDFSQNRWLATE